MNLFDEEEKVNTMSDSRKKVLIAMAICIMMVIFLLMLLSSIKKNKPKSLALYIDGTSVKITNNMFTQNDDPSVTYISLNQIAKALGYNYISGDYLNKNNDEGNMKKAYLQGTKQIIGFEANSKKIYKTVLNSSIDYQYLKLEKEIIEKENELYISLEDLNVGCNVLYSYSKENNRIDINTIDNKLEKYIADFKAKKVGYTILDTPYDNQKTILYGMLIVKNNTGKYGLIDTTKYGSIINFIYDTMLFDETTQTFIVSSDKKYGVVDKEGKVVIKLSYNDMEKINNNPLYYKVKGSSNKYGVLDSEGNIIVSREYDKIGISSENLNTGILIINDIGDNGDTGIVVCKNNKYGIVNVKNRKEIIECELDSIIYKEYEPGKMDYFIKKDDEEKLLDDYLVELNTTIVNF